MYRCGNCKIIQSPGTRALQQVTDSEPATYPYRSNANLLKVEGEWEYRDDPGGTGWRIVKEILVCPTCFGKPAPAPLTFPTDRARMSLRAERKK